jgi:hypothetical protein
MRRTPDARLLTSPQPDELDGDGELEARLFAPDAPATSSRPEPDFAVVQRELRRMGVTLMLL